jgi:hypothetical protein
MFWDPESSQAPVRNPAPLIANLRREFTPSVGVNGCQVIIRPKDFFVNSFDAVNSNLECLYFI